ncbi:PatU [Microcoleus sp. FACHB-1515]|uniref:PatU n=1 Tax=Cyanophyceae TaxID=3028117 RepID=UPI0016831617|nr:PatU [Microcoleus sp. FACHB-1515]MBD2088459.1 PatU [Microcoleus sp. FACHB-1515]
MNNESEAIEQFLQWLLKDSRPTGLAPSGKDASHQTEQDELAAGNPAFHDLDPLDSEVFGLESDQPESASFLFGEASFQSGDTTVQDRFQTVIKRRLRAEIERNPPRFPWETGAYRYDDLPEASVWAAQLQQLNLPIALPEPVLARLFEQCQAAAQSTLREGAKLVQAVESLFPGETQALNQLAAIVMASPARGISSPLRGAAYPSDYETASPTQQMTLSLLAARTILESLSLTVSSDAPASRQWLTTVGAVVLEVSYDAVTQRLHLTAQLPIAGSLRLQGSQAQTSAQRDSAGLVSITLANPDDQPYQLEVVLSDAEPLHFAVRVI